MKEYINKISDKNSFGKPALIAFAGFLLVAAFNFSPIETGDDWGIFRGAAIRILEGKSLYGVSDYSNPPWVAALLIPFSVLPHRLGWAVLCVTNIAALMAIGLRWKLSLVKLALSLASPPMLYIFLHGQIDTLILAGICLPVAFWPVVALAKPQVTIGLLFSISRRYWLPAGVATVLIMSVSLLLFGNWPVAFLNQPLQYVNNAFNFWIGLWPFQVPAGVALILLGITRRQEQFFVAGSPFVMPYATTSSMIGPWLAASTFLKEWQVVLVWLSWWGATIYRYIIG